LLVALFAARLKVSLPRLTGSMSVNLPFILLALSELSLAQALLITGASTFAQCLWSESSQQKPIKMMFNVGVTLIAAEAAWLTLQATAPNLGLGLALGALAYLLVNTIPVAAVIAFTETGGLFGIWKKILQLTFPYYLLAAGVAGLAKLATHAFDWYVPLLILPLMFLVQRSFRLYFQSLREHAGPQALAAVDKRYTRLKLAGQVPRPGRLPFARPWPPGMCSQFLGRYRTTMIQPRSGGM